MCVLACALSVSPKSTSASSWHAVPGFAAEVHYEDEAVKVAQTIAGKGKVSVIAGKVFQRRYGCVCNEKKANLYIICLRKLHPVRA